MDVQKIASQLQPDIIEKFKTAIETGKWPDGRLLTSEQRETCMQAVIAYEHANVKEEDRIGYIPPKKTPCDTDEESPIKWEK